MNVTTSEQLILGIVAERPRHGYDIEKLIDERGVRKWADIGFSSIYYVLDRLEAKGLVASSPVSGKEKKQYVVTPTGMTVLRSAAQELIAQRKPANTHVMAGLATSDYMTLAEMKQSLEQRKTVLTADLEALRKKSAQANDMPQSAQRLFRLGKSLLEAELRWIINELEGAQ